VERMSNLDKIVKLHNFTKAEALLIFDWLSEHSNDGKLENVICDKATRQVFENLLCSLETALREPFERNYIELIEKAKKHILGEN
jgi:hypothetical protein